MSPQPKRIAPGPATRRVIEQLIRIRTQRNLTYTEISDALDDLGRPIPVLGLRRLEAGERRVDVDDLEALALVLGVPPLLLLYPVGTDVETVDLLPDVHAHPWEAAKWFTGESGPPVGVGEVTLSTESPMVTGGPLGPAVYVLDRFRAHDDLVSQCLDRARVRDRPALIEQLVEMRREMRRYGVVPPYLPPELQHIDTTPVTPPARPKKRQGRT